jgi:hypothetical protein
MYFSTFSLKSQGENRILTFVESVFENSIKGRNYLRDKNIDSHPRIVLKFFSPERPMAKTRGRRAAVCRAEETKSKIKKR